MADQATKFKDLGNQAFKEQKFQEAVDYFTQAIAINPSDHVFYSNRSGAYASLSQYDKALEDAKKCVEIKPDWSKGYQRLGLAHFYLKKYDEAKKAYEDGLKIDPNNQQLKEGLERALQEMGGAEGADEGADQFVQQMLVKLMNHPKGKEWLKDPSFQQKLTMLQQNPQMFAILSQQDPRLQEAIQIMLEGFDLGNLKQQAEQAQQAQGHAHAHPHPHEGSQEQHHFEEEKQAPPKKEEKKPEPQLDEADKLKNEGNEYYKKQDFAKALEFYDKAITLKSTEIIYYSNKAACYLEMNQFEKGIEECQKAIQIAQDNNIKDFEKMSKIYARMGSIYQRQGLFDQAIDYYQKSLVEFHSQKVKDDMKKCQQMKKEHDDKAYLNPEIAEKNNAEANELFKQGDFPKALQQYNETIKRNPNEAKYYCNRGVCFMKLMEYGRAVSDFEKCLQLDPNYSKAYSKKGDSHMMMKEYHKALETYESGMKIDPNNQDCKDGYQKTYMKIYMGGETKEEQEERAKQAMKDPEIQKILMTPEVQVALQSVQQNPQESHKIMSDPVIGPKIQKLIAAGVVKIR